MITSGLPLVQSLEILGNQMEDVNFRGIVREIKTKIEGGSRFADALRDYPQCFDELYVNLVVAGEEGGLLDNVLQRLAVYMEKSEKLKKKVKSAMIYPIAIIVVAIGVTLVLLLFVIPVFEKMFKEMGAELPLMTQIVINISHLIASWYGLIAAAIVVAVVVLLLQYYKTEGGKRKIDALILKLPLFGVLTLKASVARITRTLSTLLTSGVAILESLVICAKVAGNKVIEDALMVARSRVSEGKNHVGTPLNRPVYFPPWWFRWSRSANRQAPLTACLEKSPIFMMKTWITSSQI